MMNTNGRFLDVTSFEMTQFFWVCQFLGLIPYCTFLKVSKLSNVHQKSLNTYTFKLTLLFIQRKVRVQFQSRQTDRQTFKCICSFILQLLCFIHLQHLYLLFDIFKSYKNEFFILLECQHTCDCCYFTNMTEN